MQEHIYTPKANRIFGQTLFTWLFLLLQIGLNIYFLGFSAVRVDAWALLAGNLFLAAVNVPAIILFYKYYRHSAGKEFIVTYDTLKYKDTRSGKLVQINNSEVVAVRHVWTGSSGRLPWNSHEYFMFSDAKGNSIIVTSYIMHISEFWLDALTRKVSNNKLVTVEKVWPVF